MTQLIKKVLLLTKFSNESVMKRKINQKFVILTLIAFSLFSFVFVNGHAYLTVYQQDSTDSFLKTEISEDSKREVALPDVKILGKVVNLVQRFIPGAN